MPALIWELGVPVQEEVVHAQMNAYLVKGDVTAMPFSIVEIMMPMHAWNGAAIHHVQAFRLVLVEYA